MIKYKVKSEHQLRSLVFDDYFKFKNITWEQEIDNIDFIIVSSKERDRHYLWAETKKSVSDIYEMITQLLLTIKKTYEKNEYKIPNYIGCFDIEKIVFTPLKLLLDIFKKSSIKWNIAPNKTDDPYFKKLLQEIKYILFNNEEVKIFEFGINDKELKNFIENNIYKGSIENKSEINENNFDRIYLKWVEKVKPQILVNWEEEKKNGIVDGDFFLADLLSKDNLSIKDKLLIVLQTDHYRLTKALKKSKMLDGINDDTYTFKDKQKAHKEFWSIYKRPPLAEYWEGIINRKDLLVPQDIRERKGSYFTPQIWVEKSQEYIAKALGNNWQEEYYIWDCCAGTGNLLVGINRKIENVFASTIDESDIKAIYERIDHGAALLKKNIFQFDFLNDDFKKLPKVLRDIIYDEEKRKKLIIYINPPYAEASKKRTLEGGKEGNRGVEQSLINAKYGYLLGQGKAELFVQFLTRIYKEIKGCIIAEFSTLKIISGQHFIEFRKFFHAKIKNAFVCPANTFDNVNGSFPIGFMIWDTQINNKIKSVTADVFDAEGNNLGKKTYYSYIDSHYINDWIKPYRGDKEGNNIGKFPFKGNDFQNQNLIAIVHPLMDYNVEAGQFLINADNLLVASIYFAVRKVIPADWLNDRDQFLTPDEGWEKDTEFHTNCLLYAIFNNNIQSKYGKNHWIPFTEEEINAKKNFESHFMSDFIKGKLGNDGYDELFPDMMPKLKALKFSKEAKNVLNAGRELWKYYHSNPVRVIKINASLYDIKEFFQERNDSGKMKNKSEDEEYNRLLAELKKYIKLLIEKIKPKIYEYGFLLE